MLLKRFYDSKLAQASYLVGCQATHQAIVVDANRDVDKYLRAAADAGVRVTHVSETHIHADFVSGSRELAEKAGAQLLLSDEGGKEWRYSFSGPGATRLLHDGDVIMVGNVRLDVLHTPGHTPEHLAFLITDTKVTEHPMAALTGDFIFAGDVGRPDLLERAAKVSGTMESSARALFASLQRFKELPDYLQLWPGHGAGSACGKSLGAVPSTTLGYEKIANWALTAVDENAFVREVLAGQPEIPKYFAIMKHVNRDGPRALDGIAPPPRADGSSLAALLKVQATVVDTRATAAYAAKHILGTLNIPLGKNFPTYAGTFVPYDRDVYVILPNDSERTLREAAHDLAMIGIDRFAGWFSPDVIDEWAAEGRPSGSVPQIAPRQLDEKLRAGEVQVIDVRAKSEWKAGHLRGVKNIPLSELTDRLAELSTTQPIVLHCQGGGRSSIAASVLREKGFADVTNLAGGFGAWSKEGLPTEK